MSFACEGIEKPRASGNENDPKPMPQDLPLSTLGPMSISRATILVLCSMFLCSAPPAIAEPEAVRWLREYLQIDTTNPPGNESRAAEMLAAILDREGIASRILTSPEGRSSLYARLVATGDSSGTAGALVLMHHMDVVPADGEWRVEPFSGRRLEGKIWGRGALDVKGLGIAHLAAMVELARAGGGRWRDVIFLAVADEETGGGQGAAWLLDAHPELFADVEGALNEGGSNRVLSDRLIWWGVEVTQKRPLWLRVTAQGRGGHASGLNLGSATHRLVTGLARLIARPPAMRVNEAARMYLGTLAELEGGRSAELFRRIEAGEDVFSLPMAPGLPVYFLDTIQVTEINNGRGSNVVSDQARAAVDIRLLPDTDGDALLAEVRELLGEQLEVEVVLDAPEVPASPRDHPLYRALEEILAVRAVVVPTFISGTTDSRFFRRRGIAAYGFSPFAINAQDARGVHADNESLPLDAFLRGVETMSRILRLYVGSTEPATLGSTEPATR